MIKEIKTLEGIYKYFRKKKYFFEFVNSQIDARIYENDKLHVMFNQIFAYKKKDYLIERFNELRYREVI